MEATNRTLIDLYLAFVRTWILEYQLNSIREVCAHAVPPVDTQARIPSSEPSITVEPASIPALEAEAASSEAVRAPAVAESKPEARKAMEPDYKDWQAERKLRRTQRVRPSIPARRPIPALKPAELGKTSTVAVASRATTQVRKLQIPPVVRMVLEDCKEHWHHLALALESRAEANGLKTIYVTGGRSGEGYTTVSLSLAISLARHTESRVLLMDADFSHPMVARQLSLRPAAGLEQVILDGLPIEEAVIESQEPKLSILPMVFGFEFPAMAAGSRRFQRTMQELRSRFDLIVMDGGCRFRDGAEVPLLPGIDAALIVRNPAKSSEKTLDRIDEQLLAHGISSLGVIENEP